MECDEWWRIVQRHNDKDPLYSFLMRGQEPPLWEEAYAVRSNADVKVLTVTTPGPTEDQRDYLRAMEWNLKCARTEEDNAKRLRARASSLLGAQRKMYAWLTGSLWAKSQLLLRELEAKHILSSSSFDDEPSYDGIAMLKTMRARRHDELPSQTKTADFHESEWLRMRDTTLADGCLSQDYTDKVNELLQTHLPHFRTVRLEGEVLTEALISFMPKSLQQQGVDILQQLRREGKQKDHVLATERCAFRVSSATDPGLVAARLNMVMAPHVPAMAMRNAQLAATKPTGAPTPKGATAEGELRATVNALVQKQLASMQKAPPAPENAGSPSCSTL